MQVLLENYSNLNYTGLVKILKKHDKRTGLFLRHPFITTVLRQVSTVSASVSFCSNAGHLYFQSNAYVLY